MAKRRRRRNTHRRANGQFAGLGAFDSSSSSEIPWMWLAVGAGALYFLMKNAPNQPGVSGLGWGWGGKRVGAVIPGITWGGGGGVTRGGEEEARAQAVALATAAQAQQQQRGGVPISTGWWGRLFGGGIPLRPSPPRTVPTRRPPIRPWGGYRSFGK